jgi:hypothetical protein
MAKSPSEETYSKPLINVAVIMVFLLPGNIYNPHLPEVRRGIMRAESSLCMGCAAVTLFTRSIATPWNAGSPCGHL